MKPAVPFLPLILAAATVGAQTPWIHVEVDEKDRDPSRVAVNLPLSVVQIALEAAPERIVDEGRIHLHHLDREIDVEDLRRMWRELEAAGDGELVSIEENDEKVSVRREGDRVLVSVDEGADGEKVNVQLPVAMVNALLSGEGQELNLKDALAELETIRGDVVRVEGGEATVRIWIDEKD